MKHQVIQNMVFTSICCAIGIFLIKLEFPLLPSALYLKFDFSDAFIIFLCLNNFFSASIFVAVSKALATFVPLTIIGLPGYLPGMIADLTGTITIISILYSFKCFFANLKMQKTKKLIQLLFLFSIIPLASFILILENKLFLLNMYGISWNRELFYTLLTFNLLKFTISVVSGTVLFYSFYKTKYLAHKREKNV